MTVIDFVIISNDKYFYQTQYSQIKNILLFIWGDDVLYSKEHPPTFFFFHFLWACKRYMQSVSSVRLYITIQKTKLRHLYFLPTATKLKILYVVLYLLHVFLLFVSVFFFFFSTYYINITKVPKKIKTLWTFYRLMWRFPFQSLTWLNAGFLL